MENFVDQFSERETNEALMQRFYNGEQAAFNRLAKRLHASLLCQTYQQLPPRHVGRRTVAEDLVQQALIKAVLTLDRPATRWQADKGAVRTWLGTILRNVVTSYLRTRAARQVVTSDLSRDADDPSRGGIEHDIADHRLAGERAARTIAAQRGWLDENLDRFPPQVQTIFYLKLEGQSHREIARHLGVSKSTVTHQFNTAKRALRSLAAVAA